MSIQNVPHTAGHSIILDPASFTLAQAPSRLPADTYDLVVSLGTDYHTFDRLLRWVKAYLAENPQVRCLIQHGHTSPVEGADNVKLLPAGTLKHLYAKAQVVLVQGGPGLFRMRVPPVLSPSLYRAALSLMKLSITTRSLSLP